MNGVPSPLQTEAGQTLLLSMSFESGIEETCQVMLQRFPEQCRLQSNFSSTIMSHSGKWYVEGSWQEL